MLGMRTSASSSARALGQSGSTAASARVDVARRSRHQNPMSAGSYCRNAIIVRVRDHAVERGDVLGDDPRDLLVIGDAQHGDQIFVAGDRVHLRRRRRASASARPSFGDVSGVGVDEDEGGEHAGRSYERIVKRVCSRRMPASQRS